MGIQGHLPSDPMPYSPCKLRSACRHLDPFLFLGKLHLCTEGENLEKTARVETSVAAVEISAAAVETPAGAVETLAPRRTAAVA